MTVSVADATSGVYDWTLRARGPDGPTVASSTAGGETRDVDLSAYSAPGETIRFVLSASDNAGLSREVTSALVTRPSAAIGGGQATTIVGGDGPLGEPGRIEASGVPLPDFSRIETRAIHTNQTRSYSRSGRLLVPLIAATSSRPVRISGTLSSPEWAGPAGRDRVCPWPRKFSADAGAFTIPLRVVVPREKGWPFLPVVAKRLEVHVG